MGISLCKPLALLSHVLRCSAASKPWGVLHNAGLGEGADGPCIKCVQSDSVKVVRWPPMGFHKVARPLDNARRHSLHLMVCCSS